MNTVTRLTKTAPAAPVVQEVSPARPASLGRALAAAGGALTAASTLVAWTWTPAFPGDLTVNGWPGGLQVLTLASGLLTVLAALGAYGVRGFRWAVPAGATTALRLFALGGLAVTWFAVGAISWTLGGSINVEPGGWFAAAASVVPVVGAFLLPQDPRVPLKPRQLPSWAELLLIAAAAGAGLLVFTYGIGTEGELFAGFLITAGFAAAGLAKAGLLARLTGLTARHRTTASAATLVAAIAFPFTGSDETYMSVGVNILIFATVALGLNVVVGLAGLLDLGYVAFLGVGAYTAALVSGASASALGIHLPFWAAVLAGGLVSMLFGLLIGAPTLRVRGDYLAIVTLGFGEIFRIAVNNLDGKSGPNITGGPGGIPNIPDLSLFGFDFGATHVIAGVPLGRFANYFLLMLLVTAVVVVVFQRVGESRTGRAWVAIREDETAATAMGINSFKLKLIAFALGAALAGVAGTVQAHVSYAVVPDPYQFAGAVPPNSAFLLAAVVLGGTGTVAGPLIGAALLYLIPMKLQFMQDYQLMAFGIALILLMRFRPDGLVADRRKRMNDEAAGATA
ncbi:branched-chain amino acid ABC transporter permease [Streptomyces spiroverticillatus]|uniref:Branched-chain amino acid ABC transporter permease n=1 Tax=Streptomyces finlayi TaxID=67296 RepID=A0A919C932_9ACTN|nr:branched-chain amino acid ABC transporter permease [Streptomyces finlayi]GHA02197.1 branched-chain amino acid ABC transporter permease [Streptomyces spiroverticillatus]GHC86430.1 branched-chain amino acid ABC transporter permease [Streptomyces finlayi]